MKIYELPEQVKKNAYKNVRKGYFRFNGRGIKDSYIIDFIVKNDMCFTIEGNINRN